MEVRWLLSIIHLLGMAIGLGSVWARGRALAGPLDKAGIGRVLTADNWWGLSAILLIVTGLLRAFAGYEKGTTYYTLNGFFILKMVLLAAVFILEIWPMVTFIRWRIAGGRGQALDTSRASLFSWISTAQAILLIVMVVMATGMARGMGMG
jgi:putative membrane protein